MRIIQCKKFLSFATYLLDQLRKTQHRSRLAASKSLSTDDREEVVALEKHWKQLCDGKLLEQAGEVSDESFLDSAEEEMEKLDWPEKSDAAMEAREAWREVARSVRWC